MNNIISMGTDSSPRVRPGLRYGKRPMKVSTIDDMLSPWLSCLDVELAGLLSRWQQRHNGFKRFLPIYQDISAKLVQYSDLSVAEFHKTVLRPRAARASAIDQLQDDFAICMLAIEHTVGMRPHAEQVYAAWNMQSGIAVEMQTGEGKSLVAALTAAVVARSGTGVHVITVNDYLVDRDCRKFAPLFQFLGLSASASLGEADEDQRRHAYSSDIVYVTAKQLAFDYLRDQLGGLSGSLAGGVAERLASLSGKSHANPMLTGLSFAIVDELDNIMIDDARTPMILASSKGDSQQADNRAKISIAIGLARELHEDVDFRMQRESGGVWITDQGQERLAELGSRFKGVWQFQRYRSERVRQALQCLHMFRRDHDYVVRDGRIELIDQSTGRIMSDRRLQNGLQSILEVLEKCELTAETNTEISTSFQSFFRCFHTLSGMSGTLKEARRELGSSYALPVLTIPGHCPSECKQLGQEMVADRVAFAAAIVKRVKARHRKAQPVLLATASVEQSRWVSGILKAYEIQHEVLDAVQDRDEADIVREAGRASAITVATNMAGRGTDIPLDGKAKAAGGLHVLLLSVNESKRTDRQIFGRAARQGDPGSYEILLSLDDAVLLKEFHPWVIACLRAVIHRSPSLGSRAGLLSVSTLKVLLARRHVRQRKAVMREHGRLQRMLAFGESN